eukprot:gene12719-biopygen9513
MLRHSRPQLAAAPHPPPPLARARDFFWKCTGQSQRTHFANTDPCPPHRVPEEDGGGSGRPQVGFTYGGYWHGNSEIRVPATTRREWRKRCPETVVEKLDYSPRPSVSFARPERAWPNDSWRVGRTKCRGCSIHLA